MTEFMIRGVLCQVVEEENMGEILDTTKDYPSQLHVAGSCQLDGQRYLVVCRRSAGKGELEIDHPCDLLTRRELQVALMVCQGRGNKQIAHRLHLSEWTISSYLRRIYAKFGVRTRAAMVAKLISYMPNEVPLDG